MPYDAVHHALDNVPRWYAGFMRVLGLAALMVGLSCACASRDAPTRTGSDAAVDSGAQDDTAEAIDTALPAADTKVVPDTELVDTGAAD